MASRPSANSRATNTRARILAIETSCDETAVAVIDNGRYIRANVIASQIELHQQYGGVFPEMASRAHIEAISPAIQQALQDASASWDSIQAIAVTKGPGLPGSLVVGVNAAKGICLARGLPLIGINHLEGHIYSHWLETASETGGEAAGGTSDDRGILVNMLHTAAPFPLLVLIVSGGHTELVLMRGHGQYELIGQTVDDAVGEAFDKVSRALQLGYPGGPAIEKVARRGNAQRFKFSRPRVGASGLRGTVRPYDGAFDFSFSGTKTAVLQLIQQFSPGSVPSNITSTDNAARMSARVPVEDIAASFQDNAVDWLVEKTERAIETFGAKAVLVGGGVSANKLLRERALATLSVPVSFPPLVLCTDNAAMIGAAAHFAYQRGIRDALDMDVVPDLRLGVDSSQ